MRTTLGLVPAIIRCMSKPLDCQLSYQPLIVCASQVDFLLVQRHLDDVVFDGVRDVDSGWGSTFVG
jgi:hypothetical protein